MFFKNFNYDIYIGLADKNTLNQIVNTNIMYKYIIKLLKENNIEFTSNKCHGGYINCNDKYILEESIHIMIYNIKLSKLYDIMDMIKNRFNQEKIYVCKKKVKLLVV